MSNLYPSLLVHFVLTVLSCWVFPAMAEIQAAGSVTSCANSQTTVDCSLDSGGRFQLDFFADDIVRIRVSADGVFHNRPTGALVDTAKQATDGQIFDVGANIFFKSSKMTIQIVKSPLRLVIWRADGTLVSVFQENGLLWDRATGVTLARSIALPGEHYLGLGERGGPIDRRGRSVSMRNTDWAASTSLSDPLYISTPFFYALHDGKASGVYVDSGATPFFEFDKAGDGSLSFGVAQGDLDYYVMSGPEPLAVAQAYRQLTGPNQIPPIWTLGYHQSRYSYMSQEEAISIAWMLRAEQIPTDVLYFDIDYLDKLRMFSWNHSTFPDPASMNLLLKSWGFHSVNIMEPINRIDDPLFPYLSQSGYMLKRSDGQTLINDIWFGSVGWLDFSKSVVRNWYKDALKGFMGTYHIDAVWNDLNEPAQNFMPEAIYNYDGQPRTDLEARNLYALLEAKTSFEAQRELRPTIRPWIFSRSGFSGLHRYGANWGGDADTSFASLRTNVETSLSMGLSGQPFFGHDIGGFLGSPSPELFLRWMTFSAYTPLFRNHAMNTSLRREPWAFGEPYLSMARNIINERYRLLPYFYSLFQHDANQGQPVISPLPFHFPEDETTYVIDDEFLLGPSMLIAPILTESQTARWVYLPVGATWINQQNDTPSPGGTWVPIYAAIDQIPVFIREGSIIPRAPVAQSTSEQALNLRTLDIYCESPAQFDLYEDDGTSFDYERGVSLSSALTCTPGHSKVVEIKRVSGSWAPPADRQWRIYLHRVQAKPSAVIKSNLVLPFVANEAELDGVSEGWTFTASQRVIVRVNDQQSPLSISVQP